MYISKQYISSSWVDYELLDSGDGNRLEKWGKFILTRPDPQAIWSKDSDIDWSMSDATYIRSNKGGGEWKFHRNLPESWLIKFHNLKFKIKLTNFKHTGIFPEQAANWEILSKIVSSNDNILNLFAYTGAASVICAKNGAEVTHVDSSKGALSWCNDNIEINKLNVEKIRLIPDDCLKFIKKEIRRGRKYQGIIMDPPSFGRGIKGEVWKLEEDIEHLVVETCKLLDKNFKFLLINSYTTGVSPLVFANILKPTNIFKSISYGELLMPFRNKEMLLPSGASIWAQ